MVHIRHNGTGYWPAYILKLNNFSTNSIGVAPITHYTHMRKKNRNTHGSSPNVVKVIFHAIRNCSARKEFAPFGSKFFPLREVLILKRDVIVENHCLIQ